MCAKKEGENCGSVLGLCGSGLICAPRPLNQTSRKYYYEEMYACVPKTDYYDDGDDDLENEENYDDYNYGEEEGILNTTF